MKPNRTLKTLTVETPIILDLKEKIYSRIVTSTDEGASIHLVSSYLHSPDQVTTFEMTWPMHYSCLIHDQ
jgi:hypothetical protein